MREIIKLVSSAGTGHFYTTTKNKRTMTEKFEIMKFDPMIRKHVLYKETKIKQLIRLLSVVYNLYTTTLPKRVKMRAYFFCNYYLSSIQQGIQSAHCVADMFVRYQMRSAQKKRLYDWAENHKTMVVLNGGNSKDLDAIYTQLVGSAEQERYPYARFKEDKQSLNSATTCIGIVLPEKIYGFAQELREYENVDDMQLEIKYGHNPLEVYIDKYDMSPYDITLTTLIRDYPLAR